MRNITLKQLRALAAVIKSGSMTGAARELNVTPPAITIQMQLLEAAIGMSLIERAGDGPLATQAGEKVLLAAQRIEAALTDCEQELALLKGLKGGKVLVGVVSTAKYFAPRALAAFQKLHPLIEVRLSVGNRGETIRALQNFSIDVAVMGRPPESLDVQREIIGLHPHIIVAPPDHPLIKKKRLTGKELVSEIFLMREDGSGTRALMEKFFRDLDFKPRIGMEIGSNETIKQAVMAGLGISFISAHTVAAEIGDKRLVQLQVEGLPLMREWYAVRRSEKRLLPAAEAMWLFLTSQGAHFLPDAPGMRTAAA
ncbi:MAG: LysR family transcriptional regulator [Chitinophagales bacterium]|nr:LysR family transcriptional regulator [Hyphomicrobiales bacterium]